MKRGVPPTELNARTGELTPPGITSAARANRPAETSGVIGVKGALTTPSLTSAPRSGPRGQRLAANHSADGRRNISTTPATASTTGARTISDDPPPPTLSSRNPQNSAVSAVAVTRPHDLPAKAAIAMPT